jgi:hypothetical protein
MRVEKQPAVEPLRTLAAEILTKASLVAILAVNIGLRHTQHDADAVQERSGDDPRHRQAIVGPDRVADPTAPVVSRPAGDDIDGSGQGAATEHRRLRPPDDLDAPGGVEIERGEVAEPRNAVQEDADLAVGDQDIGSAPNDRTVAVPPEGLLQLNAGRVASDVGQILELTVLDGFFREGRDRDRHVLKRLLAAARRDDDVLDGRGFGLGGLLGKGRRGRGEQGGERSARQDHRPGPHGTHGIRHQTSPSNWPNDILIDHLTMDGVRRASTL